MPDVPGIKKPSLFALPQMQSRLTFIYLERCTISREDGAITVIDEKGTVYLPAAAISAILLGPGTNMTHRAMELIGDCSVSLVWVGEHGVRYYASGRPATHKSALLIRQAEMVSNMRDHLDVARKMYAMRFPDEDVSHMTMQQLRGKEGARVRKTYRTYSEKYHIEWKGRSYDADDFFASDPVNQALSAGNVCLYGLAAAIISALGCSVGLGFVHVGHEMSFAYDLADLYKAEITIPLAFELAAEGAANIAREMRLRTRDAMVRCKIAERMVRDIHYLLQSQEEAESQTANNIVYLWNNREPDAQSGVLYGLEGEVFKPRKDNNAGDYSKPLPE